jgi:hypothetical protein
MESENNEGMAYLTALKMSAVTEAMAAPAQETDSSAMAREIAPQQQFLGLEKRRTPRYLCEGSIEMREEGCDVRTWAAVTDISLHGCYVEAQATYPAGTVLHLKLQAAGIKVQTKGAVRVNYPYLGMGISFTEIPDEERSRLRLLLTSITRPNVIIGPRIVAPMPVIETPKLILLITHPEAAIRALTNFFESEQTLKREDFLKILTASQSSKDTASKDTAIHDAVSSAATSQ